MSTLVDAWNTTGRTENGMKTNLSSNDAVLDLFFLAGASRGKDISNLFVQAYDTDTDLALRCLLWLRDVRGGAGERDQFRRLLHLTATRYPKVAVKLIPFIHEVGRWDDYLVLHDTPIWPETASFIKSALDAGNGLCAKWLPRKGPIAYKLRHHFGLPPKRYRKLLVGLTDVVENKMCANQWPEINYNHVPSQASRIYRKAFARHDSERYEKWLMSLSEGSHDVKVNAGAIFPHDVIRSERRLADAQWEALPNYMEKTNERILPVCDVSGSMIGRVGGTVAPIDVSVSLGLYISERNEGPFKDVVCTFSDKPDLVKLRSKNITDRVRELQRINWGFTTNLLGVFQQILELGREHRVPENQMPSMVLIISDMEFNACVRFDDSAIGGIRRRYNHSGYNLPKVVFWNVNGREGNSPVTTYDKNTALVSGFSPSIMTSLLSSPENFSPIGIMMETLMNERYNWNT